ncbi:Cysteine protease atg4 [Xanthoria parietina]
MSGKDFGGYKRIVQYFWDPEPKNDDPSDPLIWCLEESGHTTNTPENPPPQSSTSERKPADGEVRAPKPPSASRVEDREWPSDFLDDFESRIWMTYRSNFPNIRRSDHPNASASMTFAVRLRSQLVDQGGFTSDTGWGYWRRGMQQREEKELLSLFADDPGAPFSIHKFVEHGASACGKHPGEWFGPSATARCIQALSQQSATDLKVYINGDGADVYEDRLLSLATASTGQFTPILVLVGIRLGIDRVTPAYWEALKASLQLPQSVGIAGGRPSSSHYFVGHQGDSFFFLDPHQPRPALPRYSDVNEYSKEDIDSCHTRTITPHPDPRNGSQHAAWVFDS